MKVTEKFKLETILETIRTKANLGKTRIGMFDWLGSGNVYRDCARFAAVRKRFGVRLVMITTESNGSIIDMFDNGNLDRFYITKDEYNVLCLDIELTTELSGHYLINRLKEPKSGIGREILDFFTNDVYLNENEQAPSIFARPDNCKKIDDEYYIKEYGIIPGKTYLLCPESRSEFELPTHFWNLLSETLKILGFRPVFNVARPRASKLYTGDILLAPYSDVVGVANLCGNVIATRSGLCDILYFASDAKMTVFSSPSRFHHANLSRFNCGYKDKSLLTNIMVSNPRDCGVIKVVEQLIQERTAAAIRHLAVSIDSLSEGKVCRDVPETEWCVPDKITKLKRDAALLLRADCGAEICDPEYSLRIYGDVLQMNLKPDIPIETLNVCFEVYRDNKRILYLREYPLCWFFLKIKRAGKYHVNVRVAQNDEVRVMKFTTNSLDYTPIE